MLLNFAFGLLIGLSISSAIVLINKFLGFDNELSSILKLGFHAVMVDILVFSIGYGILFLILNNTSSDIAAVIALSFILSYPFLIKPFFFKLKKGEQVALLEKYILEKTQIKVTIRLSDAAIINAYAFGALPFASVIVLSRKLYDKLSPNDLKAIVMHELAHLRKGHILFLYFFHVLTSFIILKYFKTIISVSKELNTVHNLLLFTMGTAVLALILYFIQAFIMRKFEHSADQYAADKVGIDHYCNMLENLNEITDGALVKKDFLHPELKKRLAYVQKNQL